jgi:hypothetical protein
MALFVAGSAGAEQITPGLKVAFFGDQGLTPRSKAVLRMVKAEGAHMVLHLGDFDYADDAEAFDDQINRVLGEDFPYFAVIGNHDVKAWPAYQRKLRARLRRISGAECEGDLGYKTACTYKGLFFTLSAVGIWPREGGPADAVTQRQAHVAFITNALARSDARWKVCVWHKNQHAMQVGHKNDETGWGVYEACRKAGAIIATGHEHSYSRTHLISAFRDPPVVSSTSNILRLEKGRTFAFVSGLGGKSARGLNRRPDRKGPEPWWAAAYTREGGATSGALFCTFNPGRRKRTAECYFKAVEGNIIDRFTVIAPPADE